MNANPRSWCRLLLATIVAVVGGLACAQPDGQVPVGKDSPAPVTKDAISRPEHETVRAYDSGGRSDQSAKTLLLIQDASPSVRSSAAYSLAKTEPLSSIPALYRLAVDDPDVGVRVDSVRALGFIGRPEIETSLDAVLKSKPPKAVRYETIKALGTLRTESSLNILINELNQTSVDLRPAVLEVLGRRAEPRAYSAIAKYTNDSDPLVGARAVWALGELRDPKATSLLLNVFSYSKDLEVRRQTASALGRVSDPVAKNALVKAVLSQAEQPAVRVSALHAISRSTLAESDLPKLLLLSQDKDASVRAAACFVILKARDRIASEALEGLVNDVDPRVRLTAAIAMGLQPARFRTSLGRLSADKSAAPELRLVALSGLSALPTDQLEEQPTMSQLMRLLDSSEAVDIQVGAIHILSKMKTAAADKALREVAARRRMPGAVQEALGSIAEQGRPPRTD